MKRSFKSFVVGFLCGVLLLGSIPALASTVRELSASFNGIKITLDGQEIVPTDALGNPVEPFVVDGTTYLPVRAVASAVGLDVAWDGETQTVVLTTPGAAQPVPVPDNSGKNIDIQILEGVLADDNGSPVFALQLKNNMDRNIVRFDLVFRPYDAYGKLLDAFLYEESAHSTHFFESGSERVSKWGLDAYQGIQKLEVAVAKYALEDGTAVEIPEKDRNWFAMTKSQAGRVVPPKAYITMAEYNRIKAGMAYEEVVEIIGSSGWVEMDYGSGSILYSWNGFFSGSGASVLFNNGIVSSFAQSGLQ